VFVIHRHRACPGGLTAFALVAYGRFLMCGK
jgi:hypothetical protein